MTVSFLWFIFLYLHTFKICVFCKSSTENNLEKRETPLEKYICAEEKAFPYAMFFVVIFITIFLLGLAKGIIGLICSRKIGMFGLNLLLDLPHPINHYYEPELRNEKVVYDEEGWPVHPVTRTRMRIINESSELCLNTVFFFAFPFFVLWVGIQNLCHCYETVYDDSCSERHSDTSNKCFNLGSPRYKAATEKTRLNPIKSCPSFCKEKYRCANMKNKSKLDTYDDENDTSEDKDTKYVLEQLSKSEDCLNNKCQLEDDEIPKCYRSK